ncbi:MAG: DUF1109 domain-containing protein [Burkholderiales bacterium]|nr:DUF1109 domain-containing protein [Burkholderiales bacterium]
MQTGELIKLLAADAAPVDRRAVARRFALAGALSVGAAVALMWLALGLNPRLGEYLALPMFGVKLGFGVLVAGAAALALWRLARPGRRLAWAGATLVLPFVGVVALGLYCLQGAAAAERMHAWMGAAWVSCLVRINLLAVPAVLAVLPVLRAMAPTRLMLTGAVAGLWAGGVGASDYAPHCPELTPPFIASWYALGIAGAALWGAAAGPRLLRW